MPTAAPSPPAFSPWLEAARGAACLAVVTYHADLHSAGPRHPVEQLASRVAVHGWLGVPVFFALSGYLIAGALERRAALGHGPVSFWRDRLLRIYPVFWAAFLFSGLLALAATPFNGLAPASAWPATPTAWLGDLTLAGVWFGIDPRLLVSWSLDYEIGFYALAGFALLFPRAYPLPRLLLFAALTATAHLIPHGVAPVLDLWPQFAVGLAVAYAFSPLLPRPARLAAAGYPFLLLGAALGRSDVSTTTAALLALAVLAVVPRESRLPLPPAWLVTLGAASYSIYLVHVPVMSPLRNLALRHVAPDSTAYLAAWLATIAAGLVAGLAFHRLVEHPCERLRRNPARS